MSHRTKEIKEAVRAALVSAGATQLQFSVCGNCHQRFDFLVDGVEGRFVFSSTPRSSQAVRNATAFAKKTVRDYRNGEKGPRKATTTTGTAAALLPGGLPPALPRRQGQRPLEAAGRGA